MNPTKKLNTSVYTQTENDLPMVEPGAMVDKNLLLHSEYRVGIYTDSIEFISARSLFTSPCKR